MSVMRLRANGPETDEFRRAMKEAAESSANPQPLCRGREEEFVLYDVSPTKAEAAALCAECPLLQLCKASAMKERPGWGVRGGIAWDLGRQVHWLRALGAARKNSEQTLDSA